MRPFSQKERVECLLGCLPAAVTHSLMGGVGPPRAKAPGSMRAEPAGRGLPPGPRWPEQSWAVTGLVNAAFWGFGPRCRTGSRLWSRNKASRTRPQRAGSLGEWQTRTGGRAGLRVGRQERWCGHRTWGPRSRPDGRRGFRQRFAPLSEKLGGNLCGFSPTPQCLDTKHRWACPHSDPQAPCQSPVCS